MSKLENPWKCDASGCGMLRANDTNHWLLVRLEEEDHTPVILVHPWSNNEAKLPSARHACGIECGLKIVGGLIAENFFPNDLPSSSTGKEVTSGA